MNVFNPLWLMAVAAVSIPVAIHLWNIKTGKTLKVGSISLIAEASRKQSRSFKLLDIILLLLRCLLLCLLALVLAIPFFKKFAAAGKSKGWLLVPQENFKEVYYKFKPLTDSLLKAGYELHDLKSGFPVMDIPQLLADTAKSTDHLQLPYWNIVSQLDRNISPAWPVYLITPGKLKNFEGKRPQISFKLHWKTYTPADPDSVWIQSAWFATNKDIHIIEGKTNVLSTSFNRKTISPENPRSSPYVIKVNNGKPEISINKCQKPVVIDTSSTTISVFEDNHEIDAAYLEAVLRSVGRFSQRNIIIRNFNNYDISKKQNWLFWLSEKPLNKKVSDGFENILMYEPGKEIAVNSWISDGDVYALPQGQPKVQLDKLINLKKINGDIIWYDGFGDPVLNCELHNQTNFYHFYSRFNPLWNELVWSAGFPKMMLKLIFHHPSATHYIKYDNRVIDARQVQPERSNEVGNVQGKNLTNIELTRYFWLLLMLIFLTERWLAYKSQAQKNKI